GLIASTVVAHHAQVANDLEPLNKAERWQAQLADSIEDAYESAECLRVEGVVQQTLLDPDDGEGAVLGGVEPVMFVAWMAPERLRTDVFRDGECFLSVSVSDGIVREYRPSVQGRPLIEYDAPGPYGVPDTVFRGE